MWSEILSAHTALGGGLVDSKDQNFLLTHLYSSFLDFFKSNFGYFLILEDIVEIIFSWCLI